MPSDELLRQQQRAIAAEEPFDALRRDAEALGVRLSLSLPLPELNRPQGRYYADWLDEEARRQPALDTDIFLWTDPRPPYKPVTSGRRRPRRTQERDRRPG